MSFVYDGSSLPTGKTDKSALPAEENPDEYIKASEWELVMQAILDIRNAILGAQFVGFSAQPSDPNPAGVSAYFWFDESGNLAFEVDTAISKGTFKAKSGGVESVVTLTDEANIATDASLSNVFEVTLAGNRTLDNPTNLSPGFTYIWIIKQDATGSRTLSYGSVFAFPGGSAPTLSTAAGSVDILSGVYDGTKLNCQLAKAFS